MTQNARAQAPLDALFLHVPRWVAERREIMVMPLGLPALANRMADEGRTVEIVHLGIERELDPQFSARQLLQSLRPRIVLLSLHWHYQTRPVIDFAYRVRRWLPDSKIVLGGLTASTFAWEAVASLPFIDAVVRGDGEQPVSALTRAWLDGSGTLGDVPNLVWRGEGGRVVENPVGWVLDEETSSCLRHGDLTLLRNRRAYVQRALYADFSEGVEGSDGYGGAAYLNAGRGCTANCASCGGALESQRLTTHREGVLRYPIEKLMKDLEYAAKDGVRVLRCSFDPPQGRAHVRRWFEAIRAAKMRLRMIYDFWYLPTPAFLDDMAASFEAGSVAVLSPECGSEAVRMRVRGLPFRNDKLLASIHDCDARGIRVHCFFTAGLPTETAADVDETARLIERIRRETSAAVSVCPMVLDPASPLFLHPERFGARLVRKSLQDFYEGVGLPEGPGYETEAFSEQGILDACNRLLALTR
jgi:radical SAM superfamily enzyme YgiQ (UPF0313 family)